MKCCKKNNLHIIQDCDLILHPCPTNLKIIFIITILTTIICSNSLSENINSNKDSLQYKDYTYSENIKSVFFFKKGLEQSLPIIELNSEEKLKLMFDDLDNEAKNFYYTIIHCNSEWQPSNLSPPEYISGFNESQIKDYFYSFNTTIDYIHYELTFPNDEIAPKICGNYILLVYEMYDPDALILTRRFYVVDKKIAIKAEIKRPKSPDFIDTGQEIDFSILHKGYYIGDPFSDIKVTILQNNRYDNRINSLKPLFVKQNELDYSYNYENVFLGGSEYRYFDIKSMRYQAEHIKEIDFKHPYYHVTLYPDDPKPFKPYYYTIEINGRYYVDVQEGRDKNIEADYVYVHFSMPYHVPLAEGDIYVYGALTDWNLTEHNKMIYNFDNRAYELTMLLKQGYYNYVYVFAKDNDTYADNTFFEGSHYETENDYIIFVYHYDNTSKYEKLIGLKFLNSLRDE
jgi:hypothetical protein